jgi:hypothetical protein
MNPPCPVAVMAQMAPGVNPSFEKKNSNEKCQRFIRSRTRKRSGMSPIENPKSFRVFTMLQELDLHPSSVSFAPRSESGPS